MKNKIPKYLIKVGYKGWEKIWFLYLNGKIYHKYDAFILLHNNKYYAQLNGEWLDVMNYYDNFSLYITKKLLADEISKKISSSNP